MLYINVGESLNDLPAAEERMDPVDLTAHRVQDGLHTKIHKTI